MFAKSGRASPRPTPPPRANRKLRGEVEKKPSAGAPERPDRHFARTALRSRRDDSRKESKTWRSRDRKGRPVSVTPHSWARAPSRPRVTIMQRELFQIDASLLRRRGCAAPWRIGAPPSNLRDLTQSPIVKAL